MMATYVILNKSSLVNIQELNFDRKSLNIVLA